MKELVSPDGKMKINVHPSKIESMMNKGWKEEGSKAKRTPKKTEEQPLEEKTQED